MQMRNSNEDSLREYIQSGRSVLRGAGISDYESDARLLAQFAFHLDYTGILMHAEDKMPREAGERYREYIALRSKHYPCQYIIGSQMFMGYEFKTGEGVLIPRQETELLVERALKESEAYTSCRLLDICCGTGCIGISFALKRRELGYVQDFVTMLDISDAAVRLAGENNARLGADCTIIRSDLFESLKSTHECGTDCEFDVKYHLIVSNPPYIKSDEIDRLMDEVRLFEPRLALDGRGDGLYFYDRIIKEARDYLYDEGVLLFEIGYNQFEDVRRLFVDAGYTEPQLLKDYAGLDRVVSARWSGRRTA